MTHIKAHSMRAVCQRQNEPSSPPDMRYTTWRKLWVALAESEWS